MPVAAAARSRTVATFGWHYLSNAIIIIVLFITIIIISSSSITVIIIIVIIVIISSSSSISNTNIRLFSDTTLGNS